MDNPEKPSAAPETVDKSTVDITPLGQAKQPDIVEVSERREVVLRPYRKDAYGEVYIPKTADELVRIRQVFAEVFNSHLVTCVGLLIVFLISLACISTFMGLTNSSSTSAHEDSTRILLLILGAVLGALFKAAVDKKKD